MTKLRTGFIGIGSQGGPMAERMLAAGFPLALWARRADALAPFVAQGATVAESPAALAALCDHLGVCVLDDAGVNQIADQVIPAMRPGSLLAVHSTVLPQTSEALARRCATEGILYLDAPVSGGGPGAASRTLTVMCGGSAEAVARARPVLESFAGSGGERIIHLGPAGAGQRAKIINNALLAATMGLAKSALEAGEAMGVAREALAEVIKLSTGRSFGFEIFARLPLPLGPWLGAPLLLKDINLLRTVLPGHAGQAALRAAAAPFLAASTGEAI